MQKQVRITESQLRQIIEQSVRNILSEGKFSNNVPRFADKRGNDVQKGQYVPYDATDKKFNKTNWKLFQDACGDMEGIEDYMDSRTAVNKHNDRVWSEFDDKLALKKKDEVLNMQNNKRRWAAYLKKFGLTPDDVFNMTPEEFTAMLNYDDQN